MTTQARELAKIVSNAGDLSFSDDITLASDASVLNFGADSDVTLTHVADTGLLLNSSRQLQFGDSGTFIRQEADGVLDLTSDTEIELNATTLDINANVDISGTLTVAGALDFGDLDISNVGSLALDTITNDGTDITLDSSGDIILDAGDNQVFFKDSGTTVGTVSMTSGDLKFISNVSDQDMIFAGTDGGSEITALTFDMSAAGAATFNSTITSGSHVIIPATSRLYLDGSGNTFIEETSADTVTITTNNSERLRIDSSGNVGIGVTSVQKPLHVYSSDNQPLRVESSDAYSGIELKDNGSATYPPLIAALSDDFIFYGGHGSTRPEIFRATTGGDVGIGQTPVANSRLTVKTQGNGTYPIRVVNSADTDMLFGVYESSNGDGNNGMLYLNDGGGTTDVKISTNGDSWFNGGDIGIGTSSPGYLIHAVKAATETSMAIQSNIGGTGSAVGGRLRLQLGAQNNSGSGQADTQSGDTLGEVLMEGQGTDYSYQGGSIRCVVTTGDGTATRAEQETALLFGTIKAGATSQVEKMRLTGTGDLCLGGTNAEHTSADIGTSMHILSEESGTDVSLHLHPDTGEWSLYAYNGYMAILDHAANAERMRWYGDGKVRFGNSSQADPSAAVHVMGGNIAVTGSLTKGSGSFRIDHPLESKKDTHDLVHSFTEAPQADLIYRGRATLSSGSASVNIDTASGMTDGTFVLLSGDVQCFTSNETDWKAVKGNVSGNILSISCEDSSSTASVSWLVIGERKDKHMIDTEWTDSQGKVIVEPLKTEGWEE